MKWLVQIRLSNLTFFQSCSCSSGYMWNETLLELTSYEVQNSLWLLNRLHLDLVGNQCCHCPNPTPLLKPFGHPPRDVNSSYYASQYHIWLSVFWQLKILNPTYMQHSMWKFLKILTELSPVPSLMFLGGSISLLWLSMSENAIWFWFWF